MRTVITKQYWILWLCFVLLLLGCGDSRTDRALFVRAEEIKAIANREDDATQVMNELDSILDLLISRGAVVVSVEDYSDDSAFHRAVDDLQSGEIEFFYYEGDLTQHQITVYRRTEN